MTKLERDMILWNIGKFLAICAVMTACMIGCSPEAEDMAGIPTAVVSWPLTGGLDTSTAPLSQVPGTFLQLDDVVQERAGEWRNRNGFTVDAADTLPNGIAPLIGKLGDAGMFAANEKLATYQPSLGSNRWTTAPGIAISDDITRVPVMATDSPIVGFAQAGNLYMVASLDSTAPAVAIFDAQGKTHAKVALTAGLYIRARCAATAGKLVAYLADGAGNLVTYVADVSTGVVTGPTTIKTGLHATSPHLDALWDGSSATITVAVHMAAGDAVRFIEHNPATGALATDVALAAIVGNTTVSLFQDYSNSGTRFVAVSDSTGPTARVLRVSSAGAILTNDAIVLSFAAPAVITGVGYSAGAFYDAVIYGDTAYVTRVYRDGGGFHGAQVQIMSSSGLNAQSSIDGAAWSHDGVNYQFVLGMHSTSTSDPQDSWVNVALSLGGGAAAYEQSRITPLQACKLPTSVANAIQFQRPTAGAHVSKFALPVLAAYTLVGGVAKYQYSIDVFTQQVMASSDMATVVNRGGPVQYKQTSFIPVNSASYIDEGAVSPIGVSAPPPALLGGVQSAGGALTLLATYQYVQVIEVFDSDGNVWRSPPSVAATYTMTGANNHMTIAGRFWSALRQGQRARVKVYRTLANGFVFRLVSATFLPGALMVYTVDDTAADTSVSASEVLYTTGEVPTAITPRASHMATAKDRLWLVNADFRTELWYSKNLRPGRQPEFTNVHRIDIDDNYGDITGLSAIDDQLIVFKKNAVYFVSGDGFGDDGSGQNVSTVLVSGDVGAIAGSPLVQAGDAVYFVSERGIYAVSAGGGVTFVGAPVDRYLNQPLTQTRERVWDGVYVPAQNEVRFVTDNYILVHSRKFSTAATLTTASTGAYWCRWKFSGGRRALVINGRMVVIKSDGTVWREGDETQLTDNGAAISGVARAAWINAAGQGGYFRLRRVRATGLRTTGGGSISPTLTVFFNGSETGSETFAPQTPITAGTTPVIAEGAPRQRRCTSFSPQLTFPPGDVTFRLDQWMAAIAAKEGLPRDTGTTDRWQ